MAHTYLLFDFGTDEEKAQLARHKLEGWKQAFRLDKKLLYKFERAEPKRKPLQNQLPSRGAAKTRKPRRKQSRNPSPAKRKPPRGRAREWQSELAGAPLFSGHESSPNSAGSIAFQPRSPSRKLRRALYAKANHNSMKS
jgi:hypothetical protein